MSEDDIFWQCLKSTFEINLQAKNEIDNMMFKYSVMSHSNSKQALQAHQFNEFSNPMSPLPATPLTPTPSCTNNTAINLPGSPEFANNRINFPQLQTQDSQSQYAVGNALLEYMQSNHVEWNETRIFLRLYFICTSFFHTNRLTVTVKLYLYFFCVSITLHSLSLIWSVLV